MREKGRYLRWFSGICCLLSGLSVVFCIGYHLTLEYYFGKLQSDPPDLQQSEAKEGRTDIFGELYLPILDEAGFPVLSDTADVVQILLIGTDARTPGEPSRSDAMILLSVNRQSRKIVACPLLRDMLVEIDGYSEDKLNSAYSYGGADLLLDTLRKNLNLEIHRYVSVDFSAFSRIVDILGGISVEVSPEEAKSVNQICRAAESPDTPLPLKAGVYRLSGAQALAFARDRSSARGDLDRTARQRALLQAILEEIKGSSLSEFLELADSVLPYVTTNIPLEELKIFLSMLPDWIGYRTVLCSIPEGHTFSFDTVRGMSVIRVDLKKNIAYLYEQIYT